MLLSIAIAGLLLVACDGKDGGRPDATPTIQDLRTLDTTGPYVSVAVDNHFHDVHPEDDIRIAADRPFVVKNQGNNLHNVTFPDTDISEDIEPGESFELIPVGESLEPGVHQFICRYHADLGMAGVFEVVAPSG